MLLKKGQLIEMKSSAKTLVFLHLLLMIFSTSGIFSKKAASFPFLSLPFFVCYSLVLFLLFLYAIGWQQVIKRIPLTTAFANKAITVVWGIIWGTLFFGETISIGKIIGASFVVIGIIIFSYSEKI